MSTHITHNSGRAATFTALAEHARRLRRAFAEAAERDRRYREALAMQDLPDYLLDDIGVTRTELRRRIARGR